MPKTVSIPLRILEGLAHYKGKENIVKVWEYLSTKEYSSAFTERSQINSRTLAEIKNHSNLLLKNNEEPPQLLEKGPEMLR